MAEYKYVSLLELETEKKSLKNDFENMKSNIIKLETDTNQMKNNLNALSGALQFVDRLILKANELKDTGQRGLEADTKKKIKKK